MQSKPYSVTVLLSSYNGESFLLQQVHSILGQRGVAVRLLVRDDGSTDSTPTLLADLASQYPQLVLVQGENLGVIESFFTLLKLVRNDAKLTADYYAISDQDDVWDVDKLVRACRALDQDDSSGPLLYCSAVNYVDQDLYQIRRSQAFVSSRIGFHNALVQNIATGCTMVLNPAALHLAADKQPLQCVMHDWWIYLVISAFGKVIYDPKPSMLYRQHQQNVLGIAPSLRSRLARRLRRIVNADAVRISTQLLEFERVAGASLSLSQRELLATLIATRTSVLARFQIVLSSVVRRQNLIDDLLIRLLILIGRF